MYTWTDCCLNCVLIILLCTDELDVVIIPTNNTSQDHLVVRTRSDILRLKITHNMYTNRE